MSWPLTVEFVVGLQGSGFHALSRGLLNDLWGVGRRVRVRRIGRDHVLRLVRRAKEGLPVGVRNGRGIRH